jgi:iron complex transport system ATP-binding protein
MNEIAQLVTEAAPRASMPAVQTVDISDLWLAYGHAGPRHDPERRAALRGVDLRIMAGEGLALVGPNGAGKSTLLRCITGLLRLDRGSVALDGIPVEELTRATIARLVAVVPQQVDLPFAMRVEEVVALGRIPHEDPLRGLRSADHEAVARAMARVGLDGFSGRDVRRLSLGERQLVLLATALAQEAPLLLLDEPTVHLDLRHQVATMELLRGLALTERTTVVAVLHDLHLAAHFFPRIAVLDEGRIVADGPPREVLTEELVRKVFGVDPAIVRLHVAG